MSQGSGRTIQARTRSDVARILATIFEDPEWRAMPLREIARHTRIAWATVQRHHDKHGIVSGPLGQIASPLPARPNHTGASYPMGQIAKPAERTVTRGDSTYTMNTAGIGRVAPEPAPVTTLQAIGYRDSKAFDAIAWLGGKPVSAGQLLLVPEPALH